MNPYVSWGGARCALCGGEGSTHVRDVGKDWLGAEFYHRDRSVCREILARKAAAQVPEPIEDEL